MRPLLVAAALGLATVGAPKAETITIGVSELDYLPHSAMIDGVYVGFAREVFDTFAEAEGLTIEYTPFPRRRQIQALLDERVDFIYPDDFFWQYTDKLGHSVLYSEPVARYVNGVSVLPENLGRPVEDISDLGVVSGSVPYPWREPIAAGRVQINENARITPLLRQTLAGRVDGVFADAAVVQWRLATALQMPAALVFDPNLPHLVGSYHLSTISRTTLMTKFNRWLKANDERVSSIKRRRQLYLGVPENIVLLQ